MSLEDIMAADLGSVFFNTEDFATLASISRGVVTITPAVIIDSQEVHTRTGTNVKISRNWVVVLVQKSLYDFGAGLVAPSPIDAITIGSRNYKPRKVDGVGKCWEYTDGTSTVFKIYVEEVS